MRSQRDTVIAKIALRRARFGLDQPFSSAIIAVDAVHLVIAELTSVSGLQGAAFAFAFSARDAAMIESCLKAMSDLVADQDAAANEALWSRLSAALVFVGMGGPALASLSVIDMAAWDLKARAVDMPLHCLLGGARDRIPAYASGGSLAVSPAGLAEEMKAYSDSGFTSMKLKLGPSPGANMERLAAVRDAVGPEAAIYADGNQQWSASAATGAANALRQFELGWLEEPVSADSIEELAEVRAHAAVPIATGETNFGLADFKRLLACRSADILMPNLQRIGGITAWLRIAHAADLFGVGMASHVNPHFALPLMCAAPNAVTLEYVPWWPNPFTEDVRIEKGLARPFQGPGFGVSLDEAKLRHNPA